MKGKQLGAFVLSILVIAVMAFTAVAGLNLGFTKVKPIKSSVKQGLDLKGGVFVVYEAQSDKKGAEMEKIIDQTIEVFRKRIDSMGLTEPVIVKEGEKRIRIELPGAKDAEDAIRTIGKTAQLKFMLQDGTVVVKGNEVTKAEVVIDKQNNQPLVSLEFNQKGTDEFAKATRSLAPSNGPIFIVLDDQVISSPTVNEEIPNGRAQISGNFTVETASELANLIRAGALPVDFKEVQSSSITATLGENALNKSILGAEIGIGLVMIFMMIYYRVPGFVASLALLVYMLIFGYSLVGMKATVTLPGIAAMILSVGMAVDANVIIFERIKDEIRNGKSIRVSIDSGFQKAMSTILDSQITTLIAGIVLYNFGTGPIRGFAVMLMLGIVASMFTAIVVTKFFMKSLVNTKLMSNAKSFGL